MIARIELPNGTINHADLQELVDLSHKRMRDMQARLDVQQRIIDAKNNQIEEMKSELVRLRAYRQMMR